MAVFATVVEAGSFTLAARALGTNRSAVSRCLAELEMRVGVRLLERTARSLELTEAGRAFLTRSQRILREVAEARVAVAGVAARG
jgi:DNA-binding transcriptional LysR family regulator